MIDFSKEIEFVSKLTGVPSNVILADNKKYNTTYSRRLLVYLLLQRNYRQSAIAKALGLSHTRIYQYSDIENLAEHDINECNKFLIELK